MRREAREMYRRKNKEKRESPFEGMPPLRRGKQIEACNVGLRGDSYRKIRNPGAAMLKLV